MATLKNSDVQDQMSPQEIIRAEFSKFDYGMDWKKMYAAIHEMVKKPSHRVLRSKNSLLFTQNDFKGNVFAILFNADDSPEMVYNMHQYLTALQKAGIKRAIIQTPDTLIPEFIERAGFECMQAPSTKNMFGYDSPSINIVVEL